MKIRVILAVAAIVFINTGISSGADEPYSSPYAIVWSPDGKTVAVTDRTAGRLTLIDSAAAKVIRNISLRGEPTGLLWSANGGRIYTAEYNAGSVAVIDAAAGKVLRRLAVGLRPVGLAVMPKANLLLTANNAVHTVSVVDIASGKEKARIEVPREPFAIAVTPDESLAVVSNLIPPGRASDPGQGGVVSLIDLKTMRYACTIKLPPGSSSVRGVVISPDGRWAYVLHTVGRTNLPTTQIERGWINTNGLTIIDLASRKRYTTLLLDHPMQGSADPWASVISKSGDRLYVSISGCHRVAAVDLKTLHLYLEGGLPDNHRLANRKNYTYGTESIWLRIMKHPELREELVNDLSALYSADLISMFDVPGQGPRGIALSPDGSRLAVAVYFSGSVALLDSSDGKLLSNIMTGTKRAPDKVRQGEMIFHDATVCFQQWMSCASCHPNEGRVDGLNWDLLNDGIGNPKNNKSLLQAYRTEPMMWRGVREDMDYAVGKGFKFLMRVPEDSQVEAVIAYLHSLKPQVSPYLNEDGTLTASAKRGKKLFDSPQTACAKCHSGELYTDMKLHDVGSRGPLDKSAIFDTPSLVEIYRTGPYLHDGSAASLREVLVEKNKADKHGKTSHLSKGHIDDLVEYLKSL